jgi:hypothetical protein
MRLDLGDARHRATGNAFTRYRQRTPFKRIATSLEQMLVEFDVDAAARKEVVAPSQVSSVKLR